MFWGFYFVLFVILKSLSLRIVRADQHCLQPSIYLPSPANVNQKSKSQTEEALNGVIGGRSYFQLSVRGPGLLAGEELCCHTHTHCLYRLPEPMQGAAPARTRREWGLGNLGRPKAVALGLGSFQSCLLPLRPGLRWNSLLLSSA